MTATLDRIPDGATLLAPDVRNPEPTGPTAAERRTERMRDHSYIRSGLRRLLAGNEDHKSLWDCGNPLPGAACTTIEMDSNGRTRVGNVVRCGSKQLCVTCGAVKRAEEAARIAWRVHQHFKAGKGLSMMTVAPRHHPGERLEHMVTQLMESFAGVLRLAAWKQTAGDYGIEGFAKVLEVTHGDNGWHPHLHILIFHERFLDVTYGEHLDLVHTFHRLFNQQLHGWAQKVCQHPKAAKQSVVYTPDNTRVSGRRAEMRPKKNWEWYGLPETHTRDADLNHGIHFTPITPDGQGGNKIAAYVGKINLELTRSDLKTGRTDGSRSLFQLMADYGRNPNPVDAALVLEACDVLKGVQLVSWSAAFRGTDTLYGEPTAEYRAQAEAEYHEANGLQPPNPDETKTVVGLEPQAHRAVERATTPNGDPLMWRARTTLEQTREVTRFIDELQAVLPALTVDHSTGHPYPILRLGGPGPAVEPVRRTGGISADEARNMITRIRKRQSCHKWNGGINND